MHLRLKNLALEEENGIFRTQLKDALDKQVELHRCVEAMEARFAELAARQRVSHYVGW